MWLYPFLRAFWSGTSLTWRLRISIILFIQVKEHLGPFVYSFKHFEVYLGHQIVGECRCTPSIHVHHRLPQVIVFQSALFTVANANLRQFITYFEQR